MDSEKDKQKQKLFIELKKTLQKQMQIAEKYEKGELSEESAKKFESSLELIVTLMSIINKANRGEELTNREINILLEMGEGGEFNKLLKKYSNHPGLEM